MSRKCGKWDDYLIENLQDPKEAVAYLNAALEEDDMPEVFLLALRNVAKAYGLTNLARRAGLNRAGVYRILSKKGNPGYKSLKAICDILGIKLRFELKKTA